MKKLLFILLLGSQAFGQGRIVFQSYVDSVDAKRVKISDTASMLYNYFNALAAKPSITSVAGLRALSAPTALALYVTADGGYWYWDNTDVTSTDNGATILTQGSGITKRVYKRIYSGAINAKWFGIYGDGSTDMATLLTTMIAAVPAGSTIMLSDSSYKVSAEVIVNKSLYFQGVGSVKITQTTDYTNIFRATASGVSFNNIDFYQTGKGDENSFPTGYGAGIVWYKTSIGQAINCDFYNCGDNLTPATASARGGVKSGAGVYITMSSNIQVDNCKYYNCIQGVNVDGKGNAAVGAAGHLDVTSNYISRSLFQNNYRGVTWDFQDAAGGIGANPGSVTDCKFIQTSTYATSGTQGVNIATNFSEHGLVLDKLDIDSVATGIALLYGSNYTKITNSNLNYCYDGISLYTSGGRVVSEITVDNVTITNSRHAGIVGVASYNTNITNSFIYNNKVGVLLQNFCFNFKLTDNFIHDNTIVGVQIDRASGVSIKDNKIYNNGGDTTNGYACGIIVNQPNFGPTAITALNILNNDFDYGYSGGAALTQTYAVQSVGTYYAFTSYASAGSVKNNYFGRCTYIESMSYPLGLHYSGNDYGGNAVDTITVSSLSASNVQSTSATDSNRIAGPLTLQSTLGSRSIIPDINAGRVLGSVANNFAIGHISSMYSNTSLILNTETAITDPIIFKQFGTERARFAATTGNYLIGSTTDVNSAYKFQVTGSIYSTKQLFLDATNTTTGTTGAQTINKPSGTVNIAAAGTSVVLTNSLISTTSLVRAFVRTNDANKSYVYAVVPAAGLVTIYVNPAPAAEISIGFEIIN